MINECSTKHPIQSKFDYKRFTLKFQQCAMKIENNFEPTNYKGAVAYGKWKRAMNEELDILNKNRSNMGFGKATYHNIENP